MQVRIQKIKLLLYPLFYL